MDRKRAYAARLRRAVEAVAGQGLEGTILAPGPNSRYLTGVDSLMLERPFLFFLSADGKFELVAPALEAGPYGDCPVPVAVHEWTDSQGPREAISEAVRAVGLRGKWGVEGRVPYLFLDQLQRQANPALASAESLFQGLREVKDEMEIGLMERSAKILSRSFKEFPGIIREGMTEVQLGKAAAEVIYSHGASKVNDFLVQSGPRTSFPHGLPTARKIRKGESIIMDVASTFEGYHADVTRTFCLGRSRELEEVYESVLAAERSGIRAAREGVTAGSVDGASRRVLKEAGLGEYFIHRTGHGLGLEVHEAPYIIEGSKERLREAMFFTVEPGAYVPGKLGVRIEDNVTIRRSKGMEITRIPKEFGWWQ